MASQVTITAGPAVGGLVEYEFEAVFEDYDYDGWEVVGTSALTGRFQARPADGM